MGTIASLFTTILAAFGVAAASPGGGAPATSPAEPEAGAAVAPPTAPAAATEGRPGAAAPIFGDWRTFTKADGLPGDKIMYVRAEGDALWVGTEHGLARIEGEQVVRVIDEDDGLAHRVVLGIDSSVEDDLWVATMGGLSHFSKGRVDTYTQFDSGLPNDVLFGVANCGQDVWVATTSGLGRFDTWSGTWKIYNEKNAPMHEIWGYFVTCSHPKYVYAAVWGGGVLEFDPEHEHWKDYKDPDGEMEIDLFRDDGLIHIITTSVDYANGILWASTYFGLSTYDGRSWKGYMDHDSGLAGNFINHARAVGDAAWLSTDRGLSWFDRETWVTYTRTDEGKGRVRIGYGDDARYLETETAMAHDFVFATEQIGDTVWVATGKGLSRGRRLADPPPARPAAK